MNFLNNWSDDVNQDFITRTMMFKIGYGPNGENYKQSPKREPLYEYCEPKKREWDYTTIVSKTEINLDKKIFNKNKL